MQTFSRKFVIPTCRVSFPNNAAYLFLFSILMPSMVKQLNAKVLHLTCHFFLVSTQNEDVIILYLSVLQKVGDSFLLNLLLHYKLPHF